MILSDFDIENMLKGGRMVIKPLDKEIIRQNGVDLRLADEIAHHKKFEKDFVLDPLEEEHINKSYNLLKKTKTMIIGPNEQVLMSTMEYIEIPDDIVGFVEIRSTWARHGLFVPPTIIDAGFKGTVTLEVINNAPYNIMLRPKQRFAHVVFMKTNNVVTKKYDGAYNGQMGIKLPKPMKIDK